MGFSDVGTAVRMRDFVTQVTIATINKMRPEERIGKVYSYNPETQLAEIYFPGDDVNALLIARFANDKIPTVSMIETYDEFGLEAEGNIVRIAGSQGAYYISDYVSGIPAVDPSARALVATNTTVLKDDIATVDGRVDVVEVTTAELADDLTVLNTTTLPALEADLGDAQLEIDALNNVTIPALNLNIAAAQGDITTLQTVTIPGLNADIADLNTTIDNLDVDTIQTDLNTLQTVTIPGLQSELDTAQSDISSFQASQDLHFSILQAHQTDINTLENTTIPNLNTQIATANSEIALRTKVSFATTQPTGLLSTDRVIWYDSDNGYTASYWNGTSWGPYQLSGAAILPGGIITSHMAANTIHGDRITAATLNADKIVAGSITTDRMTANTINGDRVTANTLNASKIVAGSITTDRMTANTILGDRIQANTLNADRIVAGSITTDRMTANTINGDRVTANTLSATKIVAASITGDRIASNTIHAGLIAVGDFQNYAHDGSFLFGASAWNVSAAASVVTNTLEPNYLQVTTIATGNNDQSNRNRFEVEPGQQYLLECEIWADPANAPTFSNANVLIHCINDAGAAFTWLTVNVSAATFAAAPGTWIPASGTVTIPANARQAFIGVSVSQGAGAGKIYRFREIQGRLKNAGKLIVDGAILTNHMTANTINGDRVTANTLNASKIVAGSITTDRMTANTIDGDRVTANTLNASKIIAGTITTDRMTANTISGDRITTNTLNGDKVITNTLHADRIQSNTITGDKIVAGTISVKHVAISDFNNLAVDINQTANRVAFPLTAPLSYVIASPWRVRLASPAASTTIVGVLSDRFAATPTDEYFVSFEIYVGNINFSAGIGLRCYDAAGASITSPVLPDGAVMVPTSTAKFAWVPYSGTVTVPANTAYAEVVVYAPGQVTAPVSSYDFQKITVRRKAGGSLIVDGSITAEKLDADAINGKTITGVTITGGTITGGVIRTSSGLPRVEISNLGGWTDRIRWYGANGTETYINGDNNGLYLKGTGNSAIHLTNSNGGNVSLIGSRVDVVGGPLRVNVGAIVHNFSSYEIQMNQTFGGTDWWIHSTSNNRTLWQNSDGWWSTEGGRTIGCNFYGGFVAWSDMKDKSSLEPASTGLADIRKLPVFDYDTKHGGAAMTKRGKNRLVRKRGVIAQDLQKVAPHLVIEDKARPGETREPFGLGVDIYGLLSTAIAAIRELDEEVTRLKENKK